jgi:ABC-type branched-subunit amino acid transport system ATPase component
MSALLQIEVLSKRFGGLAAIDNISMSINAGEVRGVIGPNGAGKTTLLNLIGGALTPSAGTIKYDSSDISKLPTHRRAALGIGRTFQNLKLFESMSVLRNVMVGSHLRGNAGIFGAILRFPSAAEEGRRLQDEAYAVLEAIGLSAQAEVKASSLSYGQKRLLEIARAMASKPRLLLLDEPAAGLNPTEAQALTQLIKRIGASGVTIILVEHHMDVIMAACPHISVLNYGKLLAEGSPTEIQTNEQVIEAYLGRPGLEERLAAYA